MRLKVLKVMLINAVFLLSLASCGGGSSSSTNTTLSNEINNGIAQKGPFSIGSNVTITKLDSSGISTGLVIQSKVSNKSGSFSYKTDEKDSGAYYHIQATGRFLDESTGSISENEITLAAITDNLNNSSINVLTHWISQRADNLLAYDKSLKASLDQSQKELLKLFGIEKPNELDLTSSSDKSDEVLNNNALLLLLSGALMEANQKYQVSSQAIINEISDDFKDDGLLNEKGDEWFIRLQSLIKDNPERHTKNYAKVISEKLGYTVLLEKNLPNVIPLASRPAAIVPPVLYAAPNETITLDGSESHDSGDIINFTWFRVDQQQFVIPLSDRFVSAPSITVPNQESVLLFTVIVTDADKLTDTAVIKVIVREPPPEVPVTDPEVPVIDPEVPVIDPEVPVIDPEVPVTDPKVPVTDPEVPVFVPGVPVNDPEVPVFVPRGLPVADSQIGDQTVVTIEDMPVNITITGSDPNDDVINFVIDTPLMLPNGILDGNAPNLVYTPTANFSGTDHFNFRVDDGFLTSVAARVDIIVLPVNDPPIADNKIIVTDEDTPVAIIFSGSDIENDLLTFRLGPNSPDNGIISGAPPNVVYTPYDNFFGDDSFDYIANDDVDDSEPAIVSIIVNPVNDPPDANAGDNDEVFLIREDISDGVSESTSITLNGSGSSDAEDLKSELTYRWELLSGPTAAIITPPFPVSAIVDAPTFTVTIANPEPGDKDIRGDYTFQLTVTDTGEKFDQDVVVITVSDPSPPSNMAPTAFAGTNRSTVLTDSGSRNIIEGDQIQLDGSGNDPEDGTNVTYEWTAPVGIVFLDSGTEFDANKSSLPKPRFIAPNVGRTAKVFTFSLIVKDSELLPSGPDTVDVTVDITPPNSPPYSYPFLVEGPTSLVNLGSTFIATTTFKLSGAETNDDNDSIDELDFSWTLESGPAGITLLSDDFVYPSDSNSIEPSFSITRIGTNVHGVYVFKLMVTDKGPGTPLSASETVTVIVPAP